MDTVKKIPVLAQKGLPPKELVNHVCVGLVNDCAKFEDASHSGREEVDYYKLLDIRQSYLVEITLCIGVTST
jgi:hypothetical protein